MAIAPKDTMFALVRSGLARIAAAAGWGEGRRTLEDNKALDPDMVGNGFLVGLHVDIAASAGGTDVDFRTNPEFDTSIHALRAGVEVGTAENTANNGLASFSASHCSVQLRDIDRNLRITEGTSPAAGGAGGIDLMLLGANNGPEVKLPVPFTINGQKGSTIIRATFATDADWPGTRRAGILVSFSRRRRSFRQAAVV